MSIKALSKNRIRKLSPIVIFVYKRPDHLKKTINSLKNCKLSSQSDLIIYSDSFISDLEKKLVKNVRDYCKKISGFKSVKIIERKKNTGMSKNIILGVKETLKKHKKGIFLEDDLLLDKYFLEYMNYYLKIYEKNHKVISIHGYSYPTKLKLPDYFFLKGADCWGWATWQRGWKIYNNNSNYLQKKIKQKKLIKDFNFNNSYNYFNLLKKNSVKKNLSWAINWYASAFSLDRLTLYPGNSLVHNLGNDLSGTNCKNTKVFNVKLKNRRLNLRPLEIKESSYAKKQFESFFLSIMNLRQKVVRFFSV